jgi:truncated hemoglobin YjbI
MRNAFVAAEVAALRLPDDASANARILSLQASKDENLPLYFWQIYSLTGIDPIRAIVERFYHKIFADEEHTWFTDVFRQRNVKHHIETQTMMWTDCFGGGWAFYMGGLDRVDYHHTHDAKEIMTADGASRWATWMKESLAEEREALIAIDPRIPFAIERFLQHAMDIYADQFDFAKFACFWVPP